MRKLLVLILVGTLFSLSGTVWAQTGKTAAPAATGAGPAISAADVAAVAVYRDAMNKLRADLKMARTEVREKNISLAKALGKGNDFSEKEVTARHADLMAAQQRLSAVELNGFLLYKKYNPTWKPDASGTKVGTGESRPARPADAASAAADSLDEEDL